MYKSAKNLFEHFINKEVFSGVILFIFAILALILANSPFSTQYFEFWHLKLGISFADSIISMSLTHWIDDGLMAIFFLMVGLEIKRELLLGELNSLKKAIFPVIAALGGMIVPAGIYFIFNMNNETLNGFGIPMATDIAFALGVMMLLGKRVSIALKVFLVSLAIVDDLGAVLIIALVYTKSINVYYLIYSLIVIIIMYIANRSKQDKLGYYLILGMILWFCLYKSGIHATITGVITAFFIPIYPKVKDYQFLNTTRNQLDNFEKFRIDTPLLNDKQQNALENMAICYEKIQSPLIRLEHLLHPISAFFIMPLFIFSNAGVKFSLDIFSNINVFLGIFLGLAFGKVIGISLFTFIAVKFNIAQKMPSITWKEIVGAGILAGIGFTMSIFISFLAFTEPTLVDSAKGATIIASTFCAIIGSIFLVIIKKSK